MATTADFYDGRGRRAVWLGSLQGNADPDTVRGTGYGRLAPPATDPYTYTDAVADDLACAGWLARFGADHLGVRLAVVNGRLPAAAFAPGENWPPLHHTWRDVVREQHHQG